jgi:hypothetical protein
MMLGAFGYTFAITLGWPLPIAWLLAIACAPRLGSWSSVLWCGRLQRAIPMPG